MVNHVSDVSSNITLKQPIYIVDGTRTPFLKQRNKPGPFSASDLALWAARALLVRQPFESTDLDEVILGCVMPSAKEANIGRLLALRLGCGDACPGWTVQRNCASGVQSIDSAMKDIALGRADLVLAGGCEAMSRAPLLFDKQLIHFFAQWYDKKNAFHNKLKALYRLRFRDLKPVISLKHGLTDPYCYLNMGQTAEILADIFNIDRQSMDAFALMSHQRLDQAQQVHHFQSELVPIYDHDGHVYDHDDGVRADTSIEKLSRLKPMFDPYGLVTAGNSSQITDGAAMVMLASEKAVDTHQLSVLGHIVDVQWIGLSPSMMGLGPVFASVPLLLRHQLSVSDIDYWEINEAFSAIVLACLNAYGSDAFCKKYFGLSEALGVIPKDRLNINGGAIAMGHPVGSSGARIVLHLLNVLKRKDAKRGIAAICIGGGQGGAILLERV